MTMSSDNLLPIIKKISPKTMGLDLVSVEPMTESGNTIEEREEIKREVLEINRSSKIDTIIDGKDYFEMDIADHLNYKSRISFFHIDYVIGTQSVLP